MSAEKAPLHVTKPSVSEIARPDRGCLRHGRKRLWNRKGRGSGLEPDGLGEDGTDVRDGGDERVAEIRGRDERGCGLICIERWFRRVSA